MLLKLSSTIESRKFDKAMEMINNGICIGAYISALHASSHIWLYRCGAVVLSIAMANARAGWLGKANTISTSFLCQILNQSKPFHWEMRNTKNEIINLLIT